MGGKSSPIYGGPFALLSPIGKVRWRQWVQTQAPGADHRFHFETMCDGYDFSLISSGKGSRSFILHVASCLLWYHLNENSVLNTKQERLQHNRQHPLPVPTSPVSIPQVHSYLCAHATTSVSRSWGNRSPQNHHKENRRLQWKSTWFV